MYKIYEDDWLKHYQFTIIDFICMQFAFLLPFIAGIITARNYNSYLQLALIMSLSFFIFILFNQSYKNIYCRGYYDEAASVVFQVSTVYVLTIFITFLIKTSSDYSRLYIGLMYVLTVMMTFAFRNFAKAYCKRHSASKCQINKVVVFTYSDKLDQLEDVSNFIKNNECVHYEFEKVFLLDDEPVEDCHFENLATKEEAFAYIKENVIDEVFICANGFNDFISDIEDTCVSMGAVVHFVLGEKHNKYPIKEVVEGVGNYKVVTGGMNVVSARKLFIKRVIDICGSLVGLFITGILFVFVAPIIYIKSPGPIFFAQTRIGMNGRQFKIYKFRSMYMDAEKRKAELMAQNKMNGLMFKMDNDPRIIKGIGHFIRATSIDEFPQMWNVLKGDMSLVGTRPPTQDEFNEYDYHHKSRLAMKPGITGLWQISGRSDITDFEDIVKLDARYISDWNLTSDVKILFKTVMVVFNKSGAV
ncbi:sugar transferase [Eubacteriaceae bacterium ES3]|nr:sugar transferase [Eubacteriaceae bacterium ES3]